MICLSGFKPEERGFIPIIAVVAILIVGAVGTVIYVKTQHSVNFNQPSSSVTSVSPSPSSSEVAQISSSNTPIIQNNKPINRISSIPTPIPTPTPTPTPTPVPQYVCSVEVQETPSLDGESNFDNPLEVQFSAQSLSSVNAPSTGWDSTYIAGSQWDFDGDGTWDADMPYDVGPAHTYSSAGSYNVRLRLKMSDGELTNVCNRVVYIPMGMQAKLTGQVFQDTNCNGVKDYGEQGISGVNINVMRKSSGPNPYLSYATVTSDSNGNYSLIKYIDNNESLSLQPQDGVINGNSIKTPFETVVINAGQPSATLNLPQVPSADLSSCSN